MVNTTDKVEQRAFPCAIGADDAQNLPCLDFERNIVNGSEAAEVLCDMFKLKCSTYTRFPLCLLFFPRPVLLLSHSKP